MSETQPKERFLQAGGMCLRALEWNGAGPAMLMLHGLTGTADYWRLLAPYLQDHYHLYGLDLRGHGDSGKPDAGYDFPTLAGDVALALDALEIDQAIIVGQSWGASIAVALGAMHPARVSRLVLVDGGFGSPTANGGMTRDQWLGMLAPPEIYQDRETLLSYVRPAFQDLWSPELESIILSGIQENPDSRLEEKLTPDRHRAILSAMWDTPIETFYPRLACPVLLVPTRSPASGAAPRQAAKEQRVVQAANLMPSCTVAWIDDTIHDVHLHKPALLAQLIDAFVISGAG